MPDKPTYLWILAHVGYRGDECLIWPFSRNPVSGRAQLVLDGKCRKAHRVMCELVNGPPPTPKHNTAHSCGNGHLGCVHPQHVSWKTHSENHMDRRRHGTAATNLYGRKGKLSKDERAQIKALQGQLTQEAIAARFGVTARTVARWHRALS